MADALGAIVIIACHIYVLLVCVSKSTSKCMARGKFRSVPCQANDSPSCQIILYIFMIFITNCTRNEAKGPNSHRFSLKLCAFSLSGSQRKLKHANHWLQAHRIKYFSFISDSRAISAICNCYEREAFNVVSVVRVFANCRSSQTCDFLQDVTTSSGTWLVADAPVILLLVQSATHNMSIVDDVWCRKRLHNTYAPAFREQIPEIQRTKEIGRMECNQK